MKFGDMSRQGWSYISEVVVESVEVDWVSLSPDYYFVGCFFILSVSQIKKYIYIIYLFIYF